jgi:hypothetical protein
VDCVILPKTKLLFFFVESCHVLSNGIILVKIGAFILFCFNFFVFFCLFPGIWLAGLDSQGPDLLVFCGD